MGKILVLCIDRDDDFGKKARVKSPIIGEKENLKAAETLALADPTESDVNALFQAVRVYKELKKEKENVVIATITGHKDRGHKADRKIVEQLEKIIQDEGIEEVALVTDGADDEQIMPLLQSRVKVSSVHTVIVRQAKELEKSYYVIKELLRDPYFARLIFGLPGIVIAIYGIVHLLNIQQISINLILGLVGVYLIIKGFGIEDAFFNAIQIFKKTTSIERASFPLYIAAAFVFLLSIWAGWDNIYFVSMNIPKDTIIAAGAKPVIDAASFVLGFIGLFTLSAFLFFAGRMGDMYYKKEPHKIRKYARSIVSMIALFIIIDTAGKFVLFWNNAIRYGPGFTDLLASVGLAIILTLVGFLVIRYLYTKLYVVKRVQKGLEVKDLEGKLLGKVVAIDYRNNAFSYEQGNERNNCGFNKVILVEESVIVG